jgi:hypothetical protein
MDLFTRGSWPGTLEQKILIVGLLARACTQYIAQEEGAGAKVRSFGLRCPLAVEDTLRVGRPSGRLSRAAGKAAPSFPTRHQRQQRGIH